MSKPSYEQKTVQYLIKSFQNDVVFDRFVIGRPKATIFVLDESKLLWKDDVKIANVSDVLLIFPIFGKILKLKVD